MITNRYERCFAADLSFFKMFWVFLIFSILGDFTENLYCITLLGHFENRSGLIYGPICEIYGFGAVLMIILLYRFKDRSILFLFLASFAISVFLEFFSSLLQEWAFGFTPWDYGTSSYAILGRAHMIYCIFWGIFGVIFVKKLYPKLSSVIEKLSNKTGVIITWLLIIFIIFDFSISTAAVYRCNQRQQNIPATNIIQVELDKYYPDQYLEKVYNRILIGRK